MLGMNKFVSKRVFGALAGAALVLSAGAASAAVINVYNDSDVSAYLTGPNAGNPYPATLRGQVNCDIGCSVLNYTGGYNFGDPGELFNGPSNSSEASEAAWLNIVIGGGTYTAADASKIDPATDSTNYTTTALYTILKIGLNPDYTVIKNTSGAALTWSWTNFASNGGGLSHTTSFGDVCPPGSENCGPPVNVVPLPAGLPLLLSAFGIGGILTRKFRKQA